jgi:hypothetical protein
MIQLLRRTLRLGVLGGIGYRVWRSVRGRRETDPWAGSWVSTGESGTAGGAGAGRPEAPPTGASAQPAPTGAPGTNGDAVSTPPEIEQSAGGTAGGTGKAGGSEGAGSDAPGPSRPATTRASKPSKTRPARKSPTGKAEEPPGERTWVTASDGVCPQTHPVKAKLSSKIFHLPGARNYSRTQADRCYPDEESAVADGFRRAQR